MSEDVELAQEELASMKARADLMGVHYHPSIGADKLREKLKEADKAADKAAAKESKDDAVVSVAPKDETAAEERLRMKRHANELVRIRLTCMNPAKKEHQGEILTVGNAVIGTIKKFIPYNADEGWHVPRIMLEQLQARQCQVFTTLKTKGGVSVRQGKLIKEFSIEILDPLTKEELHDLAQRQALSQAID